MKRLAAIAFALTSWTTMMAQESFDRMFSFSWDINTPMSNREYIDKTSLKGFHLGYREKISDHFYMGGDFNTAIYDGYTPRKTYVMESSAITTDFYKYVTTYGLTLSGDYFFSPEKRVSPFIGLGAGANYNLYRLYYNIYSSDDSGWGFLAHSQAGAILKMGTSRNWGIVGAVHYDYSTSVSKSFAYTNFTNLGFRIGVVFGMSTPY
jgi:hypothetical protein